MSLARQVLERDSVIVRALPRLEGGRAGVLPSGTLSLASVQLAPVLAAAPRNIQQLQL